MSIFTKLELDVMQSNELAEAVSIVIKYKLPAMTVHPLMASEAIFARGRAGGRYKIYTPVDWPKGDSFGMLKFRGLSSDALDMDGFEILLTGGKTMVDTRNEAKTLTTFIKKQLSEVSEVRFVFGSVQRPVENILAMCEALLNVRMPAMIRNDHHLKLQVGKANPDVHNAFMEAVHNIIRVPIKLSGNISTVRSITACDKAQRFAVNVSQARAIIKEVQTQPEQLKSILDA